jgi:hypothetical protein
MAELPDANGSGSSGAEETPSASCGRYPVTRSWSADPVIPSHSPTEPSYPSTEAASPHPSAEAAGPYVPTETGGRGPGAADAGPRGRAGPGFEPTVSAAGPGEIIRRGPGVPVSAPAGQSGPTAEQVWRTGQLPAPPRRRRRLRRVASGVITVVLLAAAGVVLYLRFHHPPLRVTGVAITQQVTNGCAVNVTGRIATNGGAGSVSYQWVLRPQSQAPQPMSESVVSGQDAVYVTVALQGQGHGSSAREVTLRVLGPGTGTASVHVVLSC